MSDGKFRLITRPNFDGVVCGGLLIECGLVGDVLFVEPKDMQDGNVAVSDRDISANLPYVEGVHLCFDHHHSEAKRVGRADNLVLDLNKPSTARVIYDHYGGVDAFPGFSTELLDAVDRADSAAYGAEDIFAPEGWTLLNFILDPRTGLARFKDFSTPNDAFLREMMVYCRRHPIEEILKIPDVAERISIYEYNEEFFELQNKRCARVDGKLVLVDLRREDVIYPGNRFTVYAAFPECNVSIQVVPHTADTAQNVIAVGKSILDRSLDVDIGALMLEYGGGGHRAAGTCRIPENDTERVLEELIARLAEND